jgi:hypothetical protein
MLNDTTERTRESCAGPESDAALSTALDRMVSVAEAELEDSEPAYLEADGPEDPNELRLFWQRLRQRIDSICRARRTGRRLPFRAENAVVVTGGGETITPTHDAYIMARTDAGAINDRNHPALHLDGVVESVELLFEARDMLRRCQTANADAGVRRDVADLIVRVEDQLAIVFP